MVLSSGFKIQQVLLLSGSSANTSGSVVRWAKGCVRTAVEKRGGSGSGCQPYLVLSALPEGRPLLLPTPDPLCMAEERENSRDRKGSSRSFWIQHLGTNSLSTLLGSSLPRKALEPQDQDFYNQPGQTTLGNVLGALDRLDETSLYTAHYLRFRSQQQSLGPCGSARHTPLTSFHPKRF